MGLRRIKRRIVDNFNTIPAVQQPNIGRQLVYTILDFSAGLFAASFDRHKENHCLAKRLSLQIDMPANRNGRRLAARLHDDASKHSSQHY
jgi:hypothetical protein